MLDVHSHILPEVDDGSKSLEETLECVRGLSEMGFSDLVCTPHFYPGRYTPSLESIDAAMEKTQALILQHGIEVNLIRGRECFLDPALLTAPERDTFPFSWENRRFQLIELPSIAAPQVLAAYAKELQKKLIFPILAHAERYDSIIKEPKRAKTYRELGFRIQVDLANLAPSAHPAIRKAAVELFRLKLVDLVASDLHRPFQLSSIREGLRFVQNRFGETEWKRYVSLP